MGEILEIRNLTKKYPGVLALDKVSFSLNTGEVHALVGENGAGKSTLIKILAGVVKPDAGEIIIEGESVVFSHPLESLQKGIAVTYQDLNLFPNLSIAENIGLSQQIETGKLFINWKNIIQKARDVVNELGVELDVNQKLGYLSIANQQLVAIARAMIHDAKILILDEPTASLAKKDVENLFKAINVLKKKGIAIIFVSHKLDEIFEISDRISVLRNGKYMGTYAVEDVTKEELISYMVGRKVHYKKYEAREAGEVLLEVRNISKRGNYKNISFNLHKGEVLGITGLVGSGRTEVAQTIFGNNLPESGEILLEGKKVDLTSTSKALEYGIGYVPENRQTEGLVLDKSLETNISVTILEELIGKVKTIDKKKTRKTVKKWIEVMGINPPYPEMDVGQFSGGNQQKAVIAKWLARNPKLLIVDEPTSGIDVGAKSEIHSLLRELANDGMGIIVVSSEIPEILAICDRILVMRRGRIVCELKGNEYTQKEILNKAMGVGK
ncbi:MAG: sugar ABC transporter ATP-binding protein [Firmicutes bacterium]|nr:sugar ABC transporter ATP-binding protein [Bacillota bacterium]